MANPLNQLGQLGLGGLLGDSLQGLGRHGLQGSAAQIREQSMHAQQQMMDMQELMRQRLHNEMRQHQLDAMRYMMGPKDIYMTPDGPLTRREVENFEWTPDIEKVSIREFLQWETDKWLSKVKMPS